MGETTENDMVIREHGLWGFACGRGWRLNGKPSLSIAPDGRPWTYHHPSPMVSRELFELVCDSARREPSADAWIVAVCDGAPLLGAWLLGRLAREREALWLEARL